MRTRKFKKSRRPHKIFLIVCEGATEEAYVNILKRFYRLPILILTRVCGNALNARLINQYIKDLGLDKDDEYRIFYLYDSDVVSVVEKISTLPGDVILTNPCIELWFLLHNIDFQRSQDSKGILKELNRCHPVWKSYAKGMFSKTQTDILLANRSIAAARSKKLVWPENPSSNIYVLLEALETEKT